MTPDHFQNLLDARANIEAELHRPIQTTRERVAQLNAELADLQTQIDAAIAEENES